MAVVFLLITVSMVAVSSDCAISKSADHIAPALALPLKARDRGDGGLSKCNPFRRSTVFHIDVAAHRNRLKELHVRHNLKGLVEIEDSDRDGHLVTVDVKTDAPSESELEGVVVIHRIVEASDMKSILIVQADVQTISDGSTFNMLYLISLAAGTVLVMLLIGTIWTCYRRCRPFQGTSERGLEPDGNMLALTGLQSQESVGFHLTSTSVESATPGNDIRQLTVPLASSGGGHVSKALRLTTTSEEVPNFMETSFDVEESHPNRIRPSYLFSGSSLDARHTSSPSTMLSRRVETASILTVMVVALAVSVHTMCVDDDINVHIVIKLPRGLLLEDVKIFYNVKYNNHVEMQAWSRNSSILHIFDLPSASTTDNSPCNETLLCGSTHSRLSDGSSMACDWSTRNCVCQRGSVMINDVCTSPPAEEDSATELLDNTHGVTAVASANLLLENLHNARNLETTYYVTDTKQLTDFFWYRDSGIRVNVGLQNIDVIPTYEDVDHEGDGDFMMHNPSGKSELEYFRSIQSNRCRYPMPDYYSLTLEIAKDRTTKASMELCTVQEYSAGRCPQGIHIGDSYVRRMLNEPCHKMGSYPELLQPAANSIVCTDSTHLLTAVFNITPAAVHPIPLVSDACRVAGNQCDQCLSQPRCRLSDELDRGCCLLDCYTRPECKLATGAYCKNPPLECAQGDSYRYTLQPVYQDLRNSYQCHIRRTYPEVLYELWFYVSVPSSHFETPRLYTAIELSDTDRHTSRGQHRHEFITVEYSFDIELEEDLILKGIQQDTPGLWNHTVHPLGQSSNRFPQVGTLRELSKNVFIASVNFDEPFAFSSSTWVVGDGCQKNVSKFVPPPSQSDDGQQAVSVSTNNLLGQPFKYLIKAANSPPSMRVLIPGNVSLLRWWFRDKPPFLITGNSLLANLTFNSTSMMINIQGFLTGCPGYLGILVNDLHRMREVVKYDVLVSCPQQFIVTFNVANQDPFMDQALEVLIDDAKHISQLLLIYSPTEQRRRQKVKVTEDRRAALFVTIGLLNLLFAAGLTLVFLSTIVWACSKSLWLVCQRILRRNSGKLSVKQDVHLPVSDNSCYCTSVPRHLTFKSMNAHQRTLVILYILWKILYIIFCTFTVFFLLLNAFIGPKAADISETVDQLQRGNAKKMDLYQQTLEEQIEIDLIEQSEFLEKVYREQMYCLEELLNRTKIRLDNLTEALNPKSVMADKLKDRISIYHKKTNIFTDNYHKKFDDDLYPLVSHYKSYVDVLSHNRWFLFPQRLFNSTLEQSKVTGSVGRATANTSESAQFRFWDFLGVQEVDQVQQWTKSVWNNYFGMMSSAIDLHTISDNNAHDNFCEEGTSTISMPWHQTFVLVNSTRFFNSLQQWGKPNHKTDPLLSFDIYSDVQAYNSHHSNLLDADHRQNYFDLVNLVEHLHIEFIRIIFFCVDIILLFHRCAHLYRRTQSMFSGFKCRTVLGHSQFWHLRLAAELNGGVGMTTHPLKTKQHNHMSSSSSSVRSPPNEGRCMSDGILLVTRPTSDLTPCTASCNNLLPVGHESSYAAQTRLNSGLCSAISSVNGRKSSQSVFCYFNVLLQSPLLRRLGLAVLVVLLLYLLMTSVNNVLLGFAGGYPQMVALYQDLVDISELLSVTSWQHLVQLAYWYKSREISEFHFSISSLQSFVEAQEEMKRRNYLDQVCSLFADGTDKSCVGSNETDGWVHDDVNTRITFPCPYNSNRSHFHTLPELNISCTKNLAALVLSTCDVIADAWHLLLASVLLLVVLHALGTVILHFVKKCNIFPIRYICETSSASTLSPSSSASRINRSMASSYSAEKSEAVSCKLELPAVYRIISSTTPETSPSSQQSNIAGMGRRSRVRFAPTVQVSSANSSFGSIPTQMQMEIGYAESNV